jgi:hypothetical protein
MYHFTHCSCKHMERVNFNQLTSKTLFEKKWTNYEQNKTNLHDKCDYTHTSSDYRQPSRAPDITECC